MSTFEIRCPECDVAFGSPDVLGGSSIRCPRGHRFNSFAIYRSFCRNIEFAARIVDYLTEAVFRDFAVVGTDADRQAVETAFQKWDFWSLFKNVVKDTITYGDSFMVQHDHDLLERIEPADADFSFEYGVRRGTAAERFLAALSYNGRSIDLSTLLHFRYGMGERPLGFSVFGGWFKWFYSMEDTPQMRDYAEDQVLTGAMFPLFFASRRWSSAPRDATGPAFEAFRLMINDRRQTLEHDVETMILPVALGREWETRGFPHFEITGAVGSP